MNKSFLNRISFLCLLLLSLNGFSGHAQSKTKQFIQRLINDTSSAAKPKWLAYPTLAYAPETNWEIGVAGVYMYYANRDTTNRLSEAGGFTFFTVEGQYGLHLDHALYSNKNKWFALGKLKFQSYPLLYYSIGPNILGDELAIAHANFAIVRERFLRKVYGHWYLGLEIDYEHLSNVRFEWFENPAPTEPILGQDGYRNLGFGLGLVYDTRHNVLNVRDGFLSEIGYLFYEPTWGSTHQLSTLFIDNRAFFKTSKRNVLALQAVGQFSVGEVPFNQLSMIGGEMIMRGYYLGKYRDNNMVAIQAEHRWLPFSFSKRIGGTVFAGVGSVSPNLHLDKILWSAGAGIRFLIFPKRDVYTRLDLGVNPDGVGFYFFIGEAF